MKSHFPSAFIHSQQTHFRPLALPGFPPSACRRECVSRTTKSPLPPTYSFSIFHKELMLQLVITTELSCRALWGALSPARGFAFAIGSMESDSPASILHTCPGKDKTELWHAGSSNFTPVSQPSSTEELDRTELDRLRCKEELQKLCENTSETSYELSLKDIVDPCHSINGDLGTTADEELHSHDLDARKICKSSFVCKPRFSFSLPGRDQNEGKEQDSLAASNPSCTDNQDKPSSPPNNTLAEASRSSPKYSNNSYQPNPSSMSKIHPSNQCSSCSSYTVFFKCRCQICGRFYCSMCAQQYMNELPTGFQCKAPCKHSLFRKRFSRKIAKGCWPFLS
ncbi:hypothetical protein KP509_34G000800 [Ceratopteris richardii]|uniref:Uncharacterized protein n=1 Tax=Ceratopteris richardii TaxID=49495 RepID=A0A8T2QGQ0_CERRI|nr:hypothetical protein KP509_34G000800 [Ceratopteris richardii]